MPRVLACLLLLVLAGCAMNRTPTPDIRYYTLEYASPTFSDPPSAAVISVSRFTAAPEYRTTKIVYRDQRFSRQEYAYHEWRAMPQSLVADHLRQDLRASGLFRAVAGADSALPATHRMEGSVETWMEVDEKDGWQAKAHLTILLLDLGAAKAGDLIVFQRDYEQSAACAKKTPTAVVQAMSQNMRELSRTISADVYAAVKAQ